MLGGQRLWQAQQQCPDHVARTTSRMPRISWPVLCPKPHRAPSRDARAELRPIVNGVSACTVTIDNLLHVGGLCNV